VNGDGFGVAWYRYDICAASASALVVKDTDTDTDTAASSGSSVCTATSGDKVTCHITGAAAAAAVLRTTVDPVVPTSHCFKFITPAW